MTGKATQSKATGMAEKQNGKLSKGVTDKRKELVKKFTELRKTAAKKGIEVEQVRDVFLNKLTDTNSDVMKKKKKGKENTENETTMTDLFLFLCALGILTSVFGYFVLDIQNLDDLHHFVTLDDQRCMIENQLVLQELARPLVNCDLCRNLREVPIEHNISREDFRSKYAYSSVPVLIKDATRDWTAMSNFSYDYFKKLYTTTEDALQNVEDECQFFPYKTEFDTLADVFNISDKRATFQEGEKPWYIGWSNCHKDIQRELRKHYQRPYFLPRDSESSSVDWLFMGGSGKGAFIHLDYVQRPSWQAQISGKKTWTLVPSPECEAVCSDMKVTVHKGDIFVVDTNTWYHSTFIHPGDISITIGSEYD